MKFVVSVPPNLAGKVARLLTGVVLGLTFASLAAGFFRYVMDPSEGYFQRLFELFDVGKEANIPTWYSTVALLICSTLLAVITVTKKRLGGSYVLHWGVLSGIFLLLSVDELSQIHEVMGSLLKAALVEFAGFHPSGVLFFAWVIPGAIFAALVALAYLRFLTHLPSRIRLIFIAAGVLYVTGALGLEMVSSRQEAIYWGEEMPGGVTVFVNLVTTAEELFEMLAIVILIYALISYIASHLESEASPPSSEKEEVGVKQEGTGAVTRSIRLRD